VEERVMRVLGGWIALTPEVDAKLLFGRHVWDCAQHADLWGRRLPELRAKAQESEPASADVVALFARIETAEAPGQTVERVGSIYRVIKPHLATVYERHLAVANPVYEPPTRRILLRCIEEERRHAAAGARVLDRLVARDPTLAARAGEWERRLLDALGAARGITGDVEPPLVDEPATPPDTAAVAQDLVAPPRLFDAALALGDLAAPLDAHRRAIARGDIAAVRAELSDESRPEAVADYARLAAPFDRVEVVGVARIGRQRVVKLSLAGPRGRQVLQERWAPTPAGWRIVTVELADSPR
jgi:hypothetical protein